MAVKYYVGVNNTSKIVDKIYIGIGGTAQLCYKSAPPVTIVTWANGTDAEIVAMVQAADNGVINLSDYWSVNDERTVHLNAMSATGVGESHNAQDVVFVLMNQGGKTLVTPTVGGRTECSFIVGMKDCLYNRGYVNSSNSNSVGWRNCPRRTWCNNVFKNALPSTLLPIFKEHINSTSIGNKSSTIAQTNDYFALVADIEVFGVAQFSFSGEGSQFKWYETSTNRIKKSLNTNYSWWGRSPSKVSAYNYALVSNSGTGGSYSASYAYGISPFGCI
jgi:hypothetical protein